MKNTGLHLSFNITGEIITDYRYFAYFITSRVPYCNQANLGAIQVQHSAIQVDPVVDRSAEVWSQREEATRRSRLQNPADPNYLTGFYVPYHWPRIYEVFNLHSFMDLISLALEESILHRTFPHTLFLGSLSSLAPARGEPCGDIVLVVAILNFK